MKVADLKDAKLDMWVGKIEGENVVIGRRGLAAWFVDEKGEPGHERYSPSTDWSQGGPIIEREEIQVGPGRDIDGWTAYKTVCNLRQDGNTPLEAAMRCFVASKFGEEVPDE